MGVPLFFLLGTKDEGRIADLFELKLIALVRRMST